jgi:poly(3-hydroxybutyrate) depolymerase
MKYGCGHGPHLTLITTLLVVVAIGTACAGPSYSLAHSPTPYVRDDPTEYYLYLPSNYSPDREWPVFVGIHGFGGSGLGCLSLWQAYADQEGFVLVCPSLADESGGWYQDEGDAVLSRILQQVAQECHVQKRVFLAGFSAGATFVQGFAFAHPDLVAAVATLSAGNYYEPAPQAQGVIFLVVIGDRDNPIGIRGAERFTQALKQSGFSTELHVLPGIGHTVSTEAKELTINLFDRLFRN